MIVLVFKLLLFSLFVYVIVYAFNMFRRFTGTIKKATGRAETCPACHQRIQVSGTDMICPECGTPLGRSKEGKLLIKVN
jgi:predicted RNA-binding Zn-ribbon protein involved in translation (DUF1610 family)